MCAVCGMSKKLLHQIDLQMGPWVGLELVMWTVERGFFNTLGLADGHPTRNMEFSSTWRIIQVSK